MAALSCTEKASISRRQVCLNDVICSKMKFAFNHPGNAAFRKLVRKYRAQYQSARREEKSKYISYIRQAILQEGGKFLKQGEGESLVYMNESQTNEKISHALRCCNMPPVRKSPKKKERTFEYFLQIQRKLLAHIQQCDMDCAEECDLSDILWGIPTPEKIGVCERNISIDSDVIRILSDLED